VDTSVCQKFNINKREDRTREGKIIKKVFGRNNYNGLTLTEELDYYKQFINYLNCHQNLTTIKPTLEEIVFKDKKNNKGRIKRLKNTRDVMKKLLEKRLLCFNEDEIKNYDKIYSRLLFLKDNHYLSVQDYTLVCSAINSAAYNKNVGLFSNDIGMIRSIVRFDNNLLGTQSNNFKEPINPIKCYTNIPKERFENCLKIDNS
jgi:hypothetical protein